MTNDEPCQLTVEQAISILDPEAEEIHAFRNPMTGIMVGSDWPRATLLKAIRAAVRLEIGGVQCCAMNHGLVVWTEKDNALFVECRNGMDYESMESIGDELLRWDDASEAE